MAFSDIPGTTVVRRQNFIRDDVTEGPMRWERARRHAEKDPSNKNAQKYLWRVGVKDELMPRILEFTDDQPFCLENTDHSTRRRYTCSVECTLMQLQLTLSDKLNSESLIVVIASAVADGKYEFEGAYSFRLRLVAVDTATLDRAVRCRVCGCEIKGDNAVVNEVKKSADTYVLVNGSFLRLDVIQVVELTQHDLGMLQSYGTPETRMRYLQDHGHPFSS